MSRNIASESPRLYNKNSTVSLGYGKQLAKIALTFVKQKKVKKKNKHNFKTRKEKKTDRRKVVQTSEILEHKHFLHYPKVV